MSISGWQRVGIYTFANEVGVFADTPRQYVYTLELLLDTPDRNYFSPDGKYFSPNGNKITPSVFPNNPGLLNNKRALFENKRSLFRNSLGLFLNKVPLMMPRAVNWKKIFFVILLPRCHGSFGRPLQKGVPKRGSNVAAWQQMAKIA